MFNVINNNTPQSYETIFETTKQKVLKFYILAKIYKKSIVINPTGLYSALRILR